MKLPSKVQKGQDISAAWANQLIDCLRALQPCSSADLAFTLTPNGWTATVTRKESVPDRGARLWKVSLADVALDPATIAAKVLDALKDELVALVNSPGQFVDIFNGFLQQLVGSITSGNAGSASGVKDLITSIINPVYALIETVDGRVEAFIGKVDPIRTALESYFSGKGEMPQNGDMIYTDELGICYTVFKEVSDSDGTYPTSNLIWRVPFVLGKNENGEGGETWFAMTTFPAPDIAEIVKTALGAFIGFVSALLGSAFEGLTQSILDSAGEALNTLYETLKELIDELLEAIADLRESIGDIAEQLAGVAGRLKDLLDNLMQLNVVDAAGTLQTVTVVAAIAGNDARQEVMWIDGAGDTHKGKLVVWDEMVVTNNAAKQEMTWIDSSTGVGYKGKTLLWDVETPNVVNVDWRPIKYIGTDGIGYVDKFLVILNEYNNVSHGKTAAALDVDVCVDGEIEEKKIIEIKDGSPVGKG